MDDDDETCTDLDHALQYFRDPEATKRAFRGGYFNSGDLAVMYPDGYISILDRSKDIIISGGEVCRETVFLKKILSFMGQLS